MGYVGCVSAACLAKLGHQVQGIELDRVKVKSINAGHSPFVEPGLSEAIQEVVGDGRLTVVAGDQVNGLDADVSIVCVGTPSQENGSLDLTAVKRVVERIGDLLRSDTRFHVVNIRSTVLPGTTTGTLLPILEHRSGKKAGADFGLCMNPEFLREGSAIRDFYAPPFTVIGELLPENGDNVEAIYAGIDAPVVRTGITAAEMVKYASNTFHALKIVFANEIGAFCKSLGIDSHEVMDIFMRDNKLNISTAYLKPGFAFGGSCLPKDLRAVLYRAKEMDLQLPVLSSVLASNRNQVETAFDLVRKSGKSRVGVFGLSFKPGTDDLRESPMVDLVERLIGKGYEVRIFDSEVSLARLHGSNKRYLERTIPHITSLMDDRAERVAQNSEILILGRSDAVPAGDPSEFDDKVVVDLVRGLDASRLTKRATYHGIAW